MKKIHLSLALLCVTFVGCSAPNEYITKEIEKQSGIYNNSDYESYQNLKTQGEIGESGLYISEDMNSDEFIGDICISFAKNEFIEVSYYTDQEQKNAIDKNFVFLNYGDKIYAEQPKIDNSQSNNYVFDEYQIYECDENGLNRKLISSSSGENNLVWEVPSDLKCKNIMIFPVGKYEKKIISMKVHVLSQNGNKINSIGEWKVNGEFCTDDTYELNANDECNVEYTYDEDTYYYFEDKVHIANPRPFNSSIPGYVEFKKEDAKGDITDYEIYLRKYINATFEYDSVSKSGIKDISVNGISKNNSSDDGFTNNEIKKLKVGDKITIITGDGYRVFCRDMELKTPEKTDDGFTYTMEVPNVDNLDFKVAKSNFKFILDKSVGFDTAFVVSCSGLNETIYYSKQKFDKNIEKEWTIGVEKKIKLSVKDNALDSSHALKIKVEKEDGNKQKKSEIMYIAAIPDSKEISLYEGNGALSNLNKIYKNVTVTVSKVEAYVFEEPKIDNARIVVSRKDGSVLGYKEVIEPTETVVFSIIPAEGYYVSGTEDKVNKYSEEFVFSKYHTDKKQLINEHPIKRYIKANIMTEDPYGECIFKLNGTVVSGKVNMREEDKLTLEYKITDKKYKIDRYTGKNKDFVKDMISESKESITIEIKPEYEGKELKREDFIKVIEKGS